MEFNSRYFKHLSFIRNFNVQTSNSVADSVLSYALAFYAMVATHGTDIMGLLGFILLACKLVVEIPKAYRAIIGKNIDGK